MRRDPTSAVTLVYTLVAMIVACLPLVPWIVRLPLTLPLIVLVPGHLLLRALDVAPDRDLLEQVMFAIGTSLALAVLVGLALNWSPWGVAGPSQPLALGAIALVSGGVALRRAPAPLAVPTLPPWWQMVVALVVIGGLCGGALAIARAGAVAQPRPGFTQAWLVPVLNRSHMVQIGLTNQERGPHTYRVVLSDHHHVTTTWTGITLSNAATWQLTFSVAARAQLEADIYIDTMPTVRYRHVSFTSTP